MLVCVTVSGITIAAATVVSGRQAQFRETDQSYYNVTSAASVFWDELKGIENTPVAIDCTCTGTLNLDGSIGNHTNLGTSFNPTTLFEKLSFDLMYGPASDDLTDNSRADDYSIPESSIDWDKGIVKPYVIPDDGYKYKSFEVEVGDLKTDVTVTLRKDSSVEFFFEEEKSLTTCTVVALAGVSPQQPTSSGNQVTLPTAVMWTPMFMRMGGA